MNDRQDVVEHILGQGCGILSDKSDKHTIFINNVNPILKSALLKEDQLSDKYVINVCKCLGISIPVVIGIRNNSI